MSVIGEFTIGSREFALGSVLDRTPEMSIEIDRIVPAAKPGVPYVWATGGDFDEFERRARESPLIESLVPVDRADGNALYRVEWTEGTESLLQEISRADVALLEAYRDGDRWFFRLRFDGHDDLEAFHAYCETNDITYRLVRVYPDVERQGRTAAFDLTPEQHDTLVLAIDRGYFEVPRRITLQRIGDEMGVSPQAVSERVRRAAHKVLRTILMGPDSGDDRDGRS